MTPAEQIAYLRRRVPLLVSPGETRDEIVKVFDLAERALLTDEEAEAVRRYLRADSEGDDGWTLTEAVLRRLLPEIGGV